MGHALAQTGLWDDEAEHRAFMRLLKRALILSLGAHLIIVLLATWVRMPRHVEQQLASIEIALTSAPAAPAPKVDEPKPVPPVVAAPVAPAAPQPRAEVVLPPKSSNNVMKDLIKDLTLPPDAPKYGDLSPVQKPVKSQLKLPDVPVAPEQKEKSPEAKPRASVAEDLNRALDEELAKLKTLDVPKPVKTDAPSKSMPQLEAKVSGKAAEAAVLVPGAQTGVSAYWSRVQALISSRWDPRSGGQTDTALAVVIKFRLSRSGEIGFVVVDETSGNGYFDDAAKRAVMSLKTLPPFPSNMPESYIDVPMRFRVGEGAP